MSWTEVFPVLDDEMVDTYEAGITAEERVEYEAWFAVDQVINRSKAKHLVVFSLFWKNVNASDPDLPPLDRETLMKAEEKRLVERFAPWAHYVQPLLNGAQRMREKRPDVGFRIYLAADLHFLIEEFTALGCEICLMKTSSLRHNPGAMWRFLALEEKKRMVTFSDADRAPLVEADIQRTELMAKIGLGFWRVPAWGELNDKGMMGYRPVLACQFGTNKPLPAGQLMKALIWHTRKGTISNKCKPPGCGEQVIYGTQWPDYGFDEWFLQAAIYPRAARHGVLSFVPSSAKSRLLPLDIEYCTWANPRAEINFFGTDGSCCGSEKKERAAPDGAVRLRRSCTVIVRSRKGSGTGVPRFAVPQRSLILKVNGGVGEVLRKAITLRTRWLVDVTDELEPENGSAELFIDRRFESADLVVSGWCFIPVTSDLSKWAITQSCRAVRWQTGAALKVPKLDAPLTLWRTQFAKNLESVLHEVDPAVQIAAWAETGKATVMEAKIKPQGWRLVGPSKL